MDTEKVKLEGLVLDPANVRTHSERNIEAIKGSLARFGQQKPIVVSSDCVVVAGNGTVVAARELGWEELDAVRTKLTGAELQAYAIADNRTAELAEWDVAALARAVEAMEEELIEAAGFTGKELRGLFAVLRKEGIADPGPGTPPKNAATNEGDLWALGDHRLLCGDATDKECVLRLMDGGKAELFATDPPFAIGYGGPRTFGGKRRGKDWRGIYHEVSEQELEEFLGQTLDACSALFSEKTAIYIWHADTRMADLARVFASKEILLHQFVVWVKPAGNLAHSIYRWRHELCAFGWVRGKKPRHGDSTRDTVWDVDWGDGVRRNSGGKHPAQKPTELFEIPMEQHTIAGDLVLEPFSGSGTQLIAAEKLGRRCRAMEIEPAFVDVAVRRWEKATGREATLDGRTFAQVSEDRLGVAT